MPFYYDFPGDRSEAHRREIQVWTLCRFHLPHGIGNYMGRLGLFELVKPRVAVLFGSVLVLALLIGVACGSAAPAEQTVPAPAEPAAAEPAAAAPAAEPAAAAPAAAAPAAASAQQPAPTAVPQAAVQPEVASAEVHPGKVTWMVGSFANERMTYCLAGGGGHDYGRQIHAFLIETTVQDGARVITPGIAEKWEVTPDGRSWTVTVRDGVRFNDGSLLTPEDVLWTFKWAIGEQASEYSTGGGCLSQSQLTESFEQTAPNQITVTYKETYATFVDAFSQSTGTWIGTVYPAGLGEGPQSCMTRLWSRPTTAIPSARASSGSFGTSPPT